MRAKLVVGVLWAASLIGSIGMTAYAQRAARPAAKAPEVIAGPDVGFRIDRYNGARPVGELVVKHDGTWVAVEFGASVRTAR